MKAIESDEMQINTPCPFYALWISTLPNVTLNGFRNNVVCGYMLQFTKVFTL